jgi:transcriptional regulator with XRE-family HTH domain
MLAERIKERLKYLEISQSELARRARVPQTTLNGLVNGGARTTPHLIRIAQALETTPAYLVGETDDPANEGADVSLSDEEACLVTLFRELPSAQQKVLLDVARSMTVPRTVHSTRLAYKAVLPT